MRVLVTGACGFIGSHMVEVLAEAGHEVIAGDLPSALAATDEDRTRFPEVCRAAGARLVPLDVTDPDSLKPAVEGAEVVFHIAAVFDYSAPESLLRAINVDGTRNLCEALVAAGACRRVVNWGAGGVYGLPEPGEPPFTEDSPKRPPNPYLMSKWRQEVTAHSYREHGLEVTTVRPISPYGPRAAYGSGKLLLQLARRPVVVANLTGNVPLGHVRDLCAAALFLSTHEAAAGESFNVTDDGSISAVDVARIVADELGRRLVVLPPVPLRAARSVLAWAARYDMERARKKGARPLLEADQIDYLGRDWRYSNEKLVRTGFKLAWPQPEPGLRDTLRWYLEHGWINRPSDQGRR